MQQDRRRNPHKPITPKSQRKPVKKKSKETNPVKNTKKPQRTTKTSSTIIDTTDPHPQSLSQQPQAQPKMDQNP